MFQLITQLGTLTLRESIHNVKKKLPNSAKKHLIHEITIGCECPRLDDKIFNYRNLSKFSWELLNVFIKELKGMYPTEFKWLIMGTYKTCILQITMIFFLDELFKIYSLSYTTPNTIIFDVIKLNPSRTLSTKYKVLPALFDTEESVLALDLKRKDHPLMVRTSTVKSSNGLTLNLNKADIFPNTFIKVSSSNKDVSDFITIIATDKNDSESRKCISDTNKCIELSEEYIGKLEDLCFVTIEFHRGITMQTFPKYVRIEAIILTEPVRSIRKRSRRRTDFHGPDTDLTPTSHFSPAPDGRVDYRTWLNRHYSNDNQEIIIVDSNENIANPFPVQSDRCWIIE